MPRNFDAIVIGSGLGGLTSGALYARAGHRVLLLERNDNFGGAATVYQHGELSIEASLHETTNPQDIHDPKHGIFEALGIINDIEFVPVANFYEVRGHMQKRDQWLEAIIQRLDEEYPGLATAITHKEMDTALSTHHYLNAPQGALYGFAPLPPTYFPLKGPPRTPKTSIEGLWLASAYADAGRFTGAMMSGATAAQMALQKLRT
jgi:phytoene dehydrogenase-like protein